MKKLKYVLMTIACAFFCVNGIAQPAGNSLLLDGINNYVTVPDNPAIDFTDSLSVEFWLNPSDVTNGTIFSKGICHNANYGYFVSVDSGRIIFSWNPNGSCQGGISNYSITDSIVVLPFQCTHISIIFDTSNVEIYVNGSLVSDSLITVNNTPIYNSSEPLRIGVYKKVNPIDLVLYYSGEIDELRFWNYKLSATEINARMNIALTGNEPGLVAYYNFEEPGAGNGFAVPNQCTATGSALDGTSVGSAATPTHISVCSTVSITDGASGTNNISVYPNPFSGVFAVKIKDASSRSYNVKVRNILSQEIFNTSLFANNTTVDLSKEPQGIYLLEIFDSNSNKLEIVKLLKQ